MCGSRETLGIVGNVAAIALISFEIGETEERDGYIIWSGLTNSGKAEGSRRCFFVRDKVAVMQAAVLLDQLHPHASVMRKVFQLVRIDRVA